MEHAPVAKLVADRVRHLRKQRGWSAQQLADACAAAGMPVLSRGTIAKIESGVRKSVNAEEVAVLSQVLGVTPTELLAPESDALAAGRMSVDTRAYSLGPMLDALAAIPAMADQEGRLLAVELLERRLGEGLGIPEHRSARMHLISILRACERRDGGLQALVAVLDELLDDPRSVRPFLELVTDVVALELLPASQWDRLRTLVRAGSWTRLDEMYRASAGLHAPLPATVVADPVELLTHLGRLNARPEGLPPVLAFVEQLAARSEPELADQLRTWNLDQAERLGVVAELAEEQHRSRQNAPPPQTEAYLVFRLEAEEDDGDVFRLGHWRQSSWEWSLLRGNDFVGPLTDVQQQVTDLVSQAEAYWAADAESIRLEFLLPRELLNLPVDQWPASSDEEVPQPLGLRYQVVVRSLERMHTKKWHRMWHRRWQSLSRQQPQELDESALWADSAEPAKLRGLTATLALQDERSLLVLRHPPAPSSGLRGDAITLGLRAGVPLMVWHRDKRFTEGFENAVHELLRSDRDLRESARILRGQAFSADDPDLHVGSHLTLLWDDPTRLVLPIDPPFSTPRGKG